MALDEILQQPFVPLPDLIRLHARERPGHAALVQTSAGSTTPAWTR